MSTVPFQPAVYAQSFAVQSEAVLTAAVRIITGQADARPRPGQLALMRDIATVIDPTEDSADPRTPRQLVAEAPTGLGKSLTELAPAAVAASYGHRTIISTESLALQAQIVTKDAPFVLAAAEQLTGVSATIAVLKGWRNYVCHRAVADLDVDDLFATDRPAAQRVTKWADEARSRGLPAEKDTCPQPELWPRISIDASDCVGNTCPFFDVCAPRLARRHVAEASIVVTNHALLGIQAAKGIPVVVDAKQVGPVHNLIVDECHALPSTVRSQGGEEVSGPRIERLASTVQRTLRDTVDGLDALVTAASAVAARIEADLAGRRPAERIGPAHGNAQRNVTPVRLAASDDTLPDSGPVLADWLTRAAAAVRDGLKRQSDDSAVALRMKRCGNRIASVAEALGAVRSDNPLFARWIDCRESGAGRSGGPAVPHMTVQAAPVHVAPMLRSGLWTANPLPDGAPGSTGGDEHRRDLNVVCMSATVPDGFCRDAGLTTTIRRYPTPFRDSYAHSVLYLPALDEADLAGVIRDGLGRARFDLGRHAGFASEQMTRLVRATAGGVLVLAATSRGGRDYAHHLNQALGDRAVFSQWDDRSLRSTIDRWKHNTASVLVGTRSLMTGLDAPGDTCCLVIIDRVPRSAPNPIDDARAEALRMAGLERWTADRMIYAADAALLMAQAAGRLIRATGDSGMVAVLDPRLAADTPISYPETGRQTLLRQMPGFGAHIGALDDATHWLSARSPGLAA